MQTPIRNLAILAHADAGKTTLTEQFLFLGGQTRALGNVDQGTASTDFLAVEQERGISVRAAHTSFQWKGIRVNLIDTPGHVDFASEVERTLRVCDGVILLISAVEGVQAHTLTLWKALYRRKIPVLLFVNKIDRVGADTEAVIRAITREMKISPLCLQEVSGEGSNDPEIIPVWTQDSMNEQVAEQLISADETLLMQYLEGKTPSFTELVRQLAKMTASAEVYPLWFGSAKMGLGVEELLDAVISYLPASEGDPHKPLSALVYSIGHDKNRGKIAHVRIFNGKISSREVIHNLSRDKDEKVTQVRRIFPGRYEDINTVEAGDIAGLSGFEHIEAGDLLGIADAAIPDDVKLGTALIMVQVKALDPRDYPALASAMLELHAEDPALELDWNREEAELQVRIMGWIQMEILERILADRFGIAAKFENPTVIYKETPSTSGEGFVRYWMPKPCWAIMRFRLEPGERGSGVVYQSIVSVNQVQQKYQNEVARCIGNALKQGIKGWEVTDLKITLIEGEDHPMHTRPGDFTIATPMGIMDGLVNTGTTFLEPMIRFHIDAAEDLLGAVASDITRMRGSFESPTIEDGRFSMEGIFPLSTSLDYPVKLSSRSGGKARISTCFEGYSECTDEQGVIRPYQGISPLDTAKYILKARKALQ